MPKQHLRLLTLTSHCLTWEGHVLLSLRNSPTCFLTEYDQKLYTVQKGTQPNVKFFPCRIISFPPISKSGNFGPTSVECSTENQFSAICPDDRRIHTGTQRPPSPHGCSISPLTSLCSLRPSRSTTTDPSPLRASIRACAHLNQ